jgi:hypothetical protein
VKRKAAEEAGGSFGGHCQILRDDMKHAAALFLGLPTITNLHMLLISPLNSFRLPYLFTKIRMPSNAPLYYCGSVLNLQSPARRNGSLAEGCFSDRAAT